MSDSNSATTADLARRLTELELGYMALERLVEELSEVVAEQQKSIAALGADVAHLNAKSHGLALVEPTVNPEDERPPHY